MTQLLMHLLIISYNNKYISTKCLNCNEIFMWLLQLVFVFMVFLCQFIKSQIQISQLCRVSNEIKLL